MLFHSGLLHIWAAEWQNQQNGMCAQRRLRSAWASTQSDRSLCCPHEESLGPKLPIEHTVKTLIRLGGCPGWSKSSLGAHAILLNLSRCGSFLLPKVYSVRVFKSVHVKMVIITWWIAKAEAGLRIHSVSPEPSLFTHTIQGTRGSLKERATSLALLSGCTSAFKGSQTAQHWSLFYHELAHLHVAKRCQIHNFWIEWKKTQSHFNKLWQEIAWQDKFSVHLFPTVQFTISFRTGRPGQTV